MIAAPIWWEAKTQPNTTVPVGAEGLPAQRDGRRHGGHPVQPVDHDERHDARVHLVGQQAPAAAAARHRGTRSRAASSSRGFEPVGQPARGDRADDVEDARRPRAGPRPWSRACPWSWAAGMKWVPIRPLVVAPQMANPPARAQNGAGVRERLRAARSTREPMRRPGGPIAGEPVGLGRRAGDPSGGSRAGPAPYGVTPRSAGLSRSNSSTSGTTARAAPAIDQRRGPPAVRARRPRRGSAGRSAARSRCPR